jgi:hypothetical protein
MRRFGTTRGPLLALVCRYDALAYAVTVHKLQVSVECTTLRADGDYSDGRRPDTVRFGDSLLEDLARRDFTINAMAVSVRRRLLFDPHGGRDDAAAGRLRAVGDAQARLTEDGLRSLRAYRFMDGKRGLRDPDPALAAALRGSAAALLRRVSRERVWAELRKVLSGPRAATVVERMADDAVLPAILHPAVVSGCRGLRAVALLPPEHLPLWAVAPDAAAAGECGPDRPDPLEFPQAPARRQTYSHIAALDLEATCDDRRCPARPGPSVPSWPVPARPISIIAG